MSCEEIESKRPKLAYVTENTDSADSSKHQTGVIFNLNNHCFDKIFDYLSLKDLHSLSETCKDMQQYTGDFFRINYAANQFDFTRGGISTVHIDRGYKPTRKTHIRIANFNRFIQKFSCSLIGLHFHYIKRHYTEFESIRHICIQESYLNFHIYFNNIMGHMLKNVEVLKLSHCTIEGNLNDVILILCENLKRLYVQDSQLGIPKDTMVPHDRPSEMSSVSYPWLQNTYASLEHLELMPRNIFEIDELCEFFELNRNVCSFSTSTQCLHANRQKLLRSNLHLDLLEIKFSYYNDSHPNIESICSLLKQLYQRNFYKKLHFYFHEDRSVSDFQHIFSLDALEKLCIERYNRNYDLSRLSSLKELAIERDFITADMEYLAKRLPNLKRLHLLRNASSEHILPFIQHSVNLTIIRLGHNVGHLRLNGFNDARTKLINARSITIYVPDNIYLNMKWNYNYGETDFDAVKIRRTTSYDWDHHYLPRRDLLASARHV